MSDYFKYLRKGMKFQLVYQGVDGKKERYVSSFLSLDDNSFLISHPIYQQKRAPLKIGDCVELYIYTPLGVYSLMCDIISAEGIGWVISHPKSFKHSQRREFLRADIRIRANINIWQDKKVLAISPLTNNICARGINFTTNIQIPEYTKIDVEFELEGRKIKTLADTVSIKPVKTSTGVKYSTAMMFTSISDKEIDYIVKQCFLFQLKEKRRELEALGD